MKKLALALVFLSFATAAIAAEPATTTPAAAPAATPAPAAAVNELEADNTLVLKLKTGDVEIRLLPEKAPKTVTRIKELARKGFYDGIVFHRVIEGFMAQTGDPTGTGRGGSGQNIPDEIDPNSFYSRGTLAMANAGPNTADSQFFIMFKDYPLPANYTIFGKVVKGMENVDKIKLGDARDNGTVTNPDKIISLKVASDIVDGKK